MSKPMGDQAVGWQELGWDGTACGRGQCHSQKSEALGVMSSGGEAPASPGASKDKVETKSRLKKGTQREF